MFNLPLQKFGYLTGRSLTTFKRDFSKAFSTTPQRWLTQKRLELAHYQFVEKKRNRLMFVSKLDLKTFRISLMRLKSSLVIRRHNC